MVQKAVFLALVLLVIDNAKGSCISVRCDPNRTCQPGQRQLPADPENGLCCPYCAEVDDNKLEPLDCGPDCRLVTLGCGTPKCKPEEKLCPPDIPTCQCCSYCAPKCPFRN